MRTIKVVDYDPRWPALFEEQRAAILAQLGAAVQHVHHIGSTSVPGLAAKPKLDIDAVLLSETLIPDAIERVKAAGYAFLGDPYGDGRWTFTKGHKSYGTRLYLCGPGNAAHRIRILFRDYLRSCPQAAAEYAVLKQRLAIEADGDWERYTSGKTDFVARIVALAETGGS